MRSLLTVLGIFIGVASVIWLLAVGEGISRKAQEEIERMGANNIIVNSVAPPRDPNNPYNRLYGVTRDDIEGISAAIPTIENAIPFRYISRAEFRFSGRVENGSLKGCTASYLSIAHADIPDGRFLTDTELANESKVCIIGASLAGKLFPYENPIGKSLQITSYDTSDYYRIIGLIKGKEAQGDLASDDDSVLIPLTTYWNNIYDFYSRSDLNKPTVSRVVFQISDQDTVVETADIIREELDRRHEKDDFDVVVPLELLERAQNSRIMFIAMLGLVAAISLLVGGIGIMNIMLATVTERTREIGIRRALGARQNDITRQFLVETIVLSVVGGVVGIIAGFLAKPAIVGLREFLQTTAPEMMEAAPESIRTMVPIVVPWSIPLAFGISVFVGVVFGLYPANKAAKMNPIDALRHVN